MLFADYIVYVKYCFGYVIHVCDADVESVQRYLFCILRLDSSKLVCNGAPRTSYSLSHHHC